MKTRKQEVDFTIVQRLYNKLTFENSFIFDNVTWHLERFRQKNKRWFAVPASYFWRCLLSLLLTFIVSIGKRTWAVIRFTFYGNWAGKRGFCFYPSRNYVGYPYNEVTVGLGNTTIRFTFLSWKYKDGIGDIKEGRRRIFYPIFQLIIFIRAWEKEPKRLIRSFKGNPMGSLWNVFAIDFSRHTDSTKAKIRRRICGLSPIRWWKLCVIEYEIHGNRELAYDVCNDPMNGCPEDFAEDFGRECDYLYQEYDSLYYVR